MLTKEKTITRLCRLMAKVNEQRFNFDVPSDCICEGGSPLALPSDCWQGVDEKVIAYIEEAVEVELLRS